MKVPLPPHKRVPPPPKALVPKPPAAVPPPPATVPPPPKQTFIPKPPAAVPPPPAAKHKPVMIDGRLTLDHLHAYQRRSLKHMMDHPDNMLWLALGLGKQQPLYTPLLTINGWKTIADAEIGMILPHPKGGYSTIEGIYPQGVQPIYELELDDGRVVECGKDHLWTVNHPGSKGKRSDPGGRKACIKTSNFTTEELMQRSYKRKYTIQRIDRVDFPEQELLIEPYLLGVLLGDGCYPPSDPSTCALSYHADDTFIVDKCERLLPDDCKMLSTRHTSENGMQIRISGLRKHLDTISIGGLYSSERFIPDNYMMGSFDQRLSLLHGLMDTDGSIRSRNRKRFDTTSKQLALDVINLVRSLGGNARMSEQKRPGKSTEYMVMPSFIDVNPFSLPRKAEKVLPCTRDRVSSGIVDIRLTNRSVEQQCIKINNPDGLYITTDWIVTHNTVTTLSAIVQRMAAGQVKKTLIVAPLRVCQLTWQQEADKWDHTKHLKFSMMTGSAKARQNALFSDADIYLTNFESLGWLALQLQEYWLNQDREIPFDMVVWDEISKMKRPESNRFKDFAPLIEHFNYATGLTASPASNGLINTWGQFFVIDGGARLGNDYKIFKQRFFKKLDGQYGKTVALDNTREMIINAVGDITIEIGTEGNVELPEFQTIDVMTVLTPKLMKNYVKLEKEFFLEIDSGTEIEVFNEASKASKLLQYSSGVVYNVPEPELRPDYRIEEFVHKIKDEALESIVLESGDEPIMLAYNFSSERDRIMKKYPYAKCLTGASELEAITIMNEFNAGTLKLLLVHPMSAGYGLNLQKACSTIVWFGLGYNLEAFEQTIGRIMRQGNSASRIKCYRILMKDTLDMAVADALRIKDGIQSDLKQAMNDYLAAKMAAA